jgi:hypothetical protein
MHDAKRYQDEEEIPWQIAVDDLGGSAHQTYGGMADPTYLIDTNGRVSFYNMWTHVPTLYSATQDLLAQGSIGVVRSGIDHITHLAPAMTAGWPAIRRGLPQSLAELEMAAPTMGGSLWLGYQLRKVLAPITQREKPLPPRAKTVLGAAALGIGVGLGMLLARKIMARST